jgi:hypothetical protein
MTTLFRLLIPSGRSLATLVLASYAVTAGAQSSPQKDPGINAQWYPTPADKVKLPQYCLSQYDSTFRKQTAIKMPIEICGGQMNHFCPAMVMLNRAQDSKYNPNVRHDYMREAFGGINYTYKGMPPNCPLKADLDALKAKADVVAKLLPRSTR